MQYFQLNSNASQRPLPEGQNRQFSGLTCKTLCSSEYKFQPVEEEPNI